MIKRKLMQTIMYFAKHYNAKCHHRHQDIIYKKQLSDVFQTTTCSYNQQLNIYLFIKQVVKLSFH